MEELRVETSRTTNTALTLLSVLSYGKTLRTPGGPDKKL